MAVRLPAILLALVFLASTADISFAQTLWNAGVEDWSASGNWTLGTPGAITDAQINNGGTAQILAPGALAFNVTLGATPLSIGSLAVQGGHAQFTSVLAVGAFGSGALNITEGGSISNIHGRIGRELGATGAATLSGPGSHWQNNGDLTVGSASGGVGTLTIENQATVYVQNDLNISNTSSVNLNDGTLRFNTAAGLNRLNYTAGTIRLAGDRVINNIPNPFGSPPPIIALFGSAPVIANGKALTVEGNTKVYSNSLTVNGGTFDSLGTLQIGSSFDSGLGVLTINNGGAATIGADMIIQASPSFGYTSVSGAGSNLSVAGSLYLSSPFAFENRLLIANQASVFISDTLSLALNSELILNGGTLRFNGYSKTGDIFYTAGAVQLAGDRTIGGDAAILDLFGSSPTIQFGKSLTVEQTATIASGLTINGGTFRANSVVVNGPLNFDHGLLEITGGTITGISSLAVPTNGEFRSRGVQALRVVGAAGSTITATGDLTLGNASAVNGFGTQGTLQVGANAVTLLDANDVVFDSLSLVTLGDGGVSGVIDAANGLTLDFGGNVTGFGAVDTPDNIATPLINNGHITGNSLAEPITLAGYVKGVGSFDNVHFIGTFAPGFSPAQLNLGSARYNGVVEIEIGGPLPGSGYDQLNHILEAGIAQLGGTLQVSLIGRFVPTIGQSFQIITAIGGAQNTFDDELLPSLGGGLTWNIVYGANSVQLNVVAGYTADFDYDGDVDGDDLTQWQGDFGENDLSDADNDGDSDGADFLAWQRQLGSGPPATAASTPVPEPATIVLLTLGPAGLCGLSRAQKKFQQLINA